MNKKVLVLGLMLMFAAAYAKPLLLIIDASGSMADSLPSGKTKLETAKGVAIDTVNTYGDQMALMVYTDCDSSGDPYTGSISVWQNFTSDKSALTSKINAISSDGYTPIANAITEGATYIKQNSGSAQILLLTDGEETCGGDVSSAVSAAQNGGIDVKVVGFALDNASAATIQTSVTQGGGQYYNAGDELGLKSAFNQALGGSSGSCCTSSVLLALPILGALYLKRRGA